MRRCRKVCARPVGKSNSRANRREFDRQARLRWRLLYGRFWRKPAARMTSFQRREITKSSACSGAGRGLAILGWNENTPARLKPDGCRGCLLSAEERKISARFKYFFLTLNGQFPLHARMK